jgi:hypothetical protein
MSVDQVHTLLVAMGRVSLVVFLFVLAAGGRRAWFVYIASLTGLFAAVSAFAVAGGGENLFPGGRSLAEVGGWPSLLAIFALCYSLAFVGLRAQLGGGAASRGLQVSGLAATTMLALMYYLTYLPLVRTHSWFVVPVIALSAALGVHISRHLQSARMCAA